MPKIVYDQDGRVVRVWKPEEEEQMQVHLQKSAQEFGLCGKPVERVDDVSGVCLLPPEHDGECKTHEHQKESSP